MVVVQADPLGSHHARTSLRLLRVDDHVLGSVVRDSPDDSCRNLDPFLVLDNGIRLGSHDESDLVAATSRYGEHRGVLGAVCFGRCLRDVRLQAVISNRMGMVIDGDDYLEMASEQQVYCAWYRNARRCGGAGGMKGDVDLCSFVDWMVVEKIDVSRTEAESDTCFWGIPLLLRDLQEIAVESIWKTVDDTSSRQMANDAGCWRGKLTVMLDDHRVWRLCLADVNGLMIGQVTEACFDCDFCGVSNPMCLAVTVMEIGQVVVYV